jgi:hypothetical protein
MLMGGSVKRKRRAVHQRRDKRSRIRGQGSSRLSNSTCCGKCENRAVRYLQVLTKEIGCVSYPRILICNVLHDREVCWREKDDLMKQFTRGRGSIQKKGYLCDNVSTVVTWV